MIRLKFTGRVRFRDHKGEIYATRKQLVGTFVFDRITKVYEVCILGGSIFEVDSIALIKPTVNKMIENKEIKL